MIVIVQTNSDLKLIFMTNASWLKLLCKRRFVEVRDLNVQIG